jgi:hypothetical protein
VDQRLNPDREEAPTLAEAMGGTRGIVETSLPGVAFVVTYTVSGSNTNVSAAVAVGVAVVLAIVRLARGETPRHALAGLVGVGFAAFIATRTGRAEDFYLPGLLLNTAYASAFLVSLALRRPLVGEIVTRIDGEGERYREDPVRLKVFVRATWLWAGLFLARLVVQLPLYLAGAVVALGVARTAMGVPLFGLGLWITYRLVRRPAGGVATPGGDMAQSR